MLKRNVELEFFVLKAISADIPFMSLTNNTPDPQTDGNLQTHLRELKKKPKRYSGGEDRRGMIPNCCTQLLNPSRRKKEHADEKLSIHICTFERVDAATT